jgi:hypothetical protein
MTGVTAVIFLGVRIQCAQCHHHPFERWFQDNYYGLKSFFSRDAQRRRLGQARRSFYDLTGSIPCSDEECCLFAPQKRVSAKNITVVTES